MRIGPDGGGSPKANKVEIGGNDRYRAVCPSCFYGDDGADRAGTGPVRLRPGGTQAARRRRATGTGTKFTPGRSGMDLPAAQAVINGAAGHLDHARVPQPSHRPIPKPPARAAGDAPAITGRRARWRPLSPATRRSRRRGVLPGESSLSLGTLPGGAPAEKMSRPVATRSSNAYAGVAWRRCSGHTTRPRAATSPSSSCTPRCQSEGDDTARASCRRPAPPAGSTPTSWWCTTSARSTAARTWRWNCWRRPRWPRSSKPARPSPVREAVVVGIQLARALDYAHAVASSTATSSRPTSCAWLAAGPSRSPTSASRTSTTPTRSRCAHRAGDVLGTPAVHVARTDARRQARLAAPDLFSAGIVLYQMIVRHRPFRGDSLVAVATKIANEAGHADRRARTDVVPGARRVIDRCLAKNPSQRFPDRRRDGRRAGEGAGRDRRGRARARPPPNAAAAREVGADDGGHRRGRDGVSATLITQRQAPR